MFKKLLLLTVWILLLLLGDAAYCWAATDNIVEKHLNVSISNIYLSANFQKDKTVFALTGVFADTDNWLYRSSDGGKSWSRVMPVLDGVDLGDNSTLIFQGLSPMPDGSLYALASYSDKDEDLLLLSNDLGDHWTTLTAKDKSLSSSTRTNTIPYHIQYVRQDKLLAISDDDHNLLSSPDNGISWPSQLKTGVADLAILDQDRYFIVDNSGAVHFTSNGGDTWTGSLVNLNTAPGLSLLDTVQVVTDGPSDFTAVAISSNLQAGLMIARNQVEQWKQIPASQFRPQANLGASRPLCAALVPGGYIFAGTPDNCLMVSEDYGATWKTISIGGAVDKIVCAPWGDDALVVLAASPEGLYRLVYQKPAPVIEPPKAHSKISFTIGQAEYFVDDLAHLADAAPFISDGRAYVPVRYLGEALGATVAWNENAHQVTLAKDDKVVILAVGSHTVVVNGSSFYISVAPMIRDGRLFLPASYVAATFGYSAQWDQGAWTVNLTN